MAIHKVAIGRGGGEGFAYWHRTPYLLTPSDPWLATRQWGCCQFNQRGCCHLAPSAMQRPPSSSAIPLLRLSSDTGLSLGPPRLHSRAGGWRGRNELPA